MGSRIVELIAPEAVLRLRIDEDGWCEVLLEKGARRYTLGAEAVTIVVERLLRGLADKLVGQSAGEIENVAVRWVLSLAERHASVYAADVGDQRVLFFQAEDGSLISRVPLSDAVRQMWLDSLRRLAPPLAKG
jgi:hypothetical protein